MGGLARRVGYENALSKQVNGEVPVLQLDAGHMFSDDFNVKGSTEEPGDSGLFVIEVPGSDGWARAGMMEFSLENRRSRIARLSGLAIHPDFRGRRLSDEAAVERVVFLSSGGGGGGGDDVLEEVVSLLELVPEKQVGLGELEVVESVAPH